MKTLPDKFTKKGFSHTLVERHGNIAIYERTKPHYSRSHFEVIRIKVAKASERFGKKFPATEIYPSSESWGVLGFTCPDLASARERAATLIGSK